jgi:Lipocalin-like domain
MNRRSILSLSAITTMALAGIALSAGEALAQQKTLKEQLVGSWRLVSDEATPPTGPKRQDFGANPRGILILDAGGLYAQVHGRTDRPKFKASADARLVTPAAEYGEAARAFAGNFGTWSVNEADKTLSRRYEAALIPNVEGTDTKASVSLSGDELKLTTTSPVTGVRTDQVYRRAK